MRTIVIVLAIAAVAMAGTCPLSDYDSNRYPATSAAVTDPKSCGWYKKDSCCKADFDITAAKNKFSGEISAGCLDLINIVLCGACSPDQAVFITGSNSKGFSHKICKSFCDDIYKECAKSTFNNTKVSSFSTSDAFCIAVLSQPQISVYTASGSCFNAGHALLPALPLLLVALILAALH